MSTFDEFMFMAIKESKGIEDVLENFFSFLRRKTDFCHTVLTEEEIKKYNLDRSVNNRGFKPNQMMNLVNKIVKDNMLLYKRQHQPYLLPSSDKDKVETQEPNLKENMNNNASAVKNLIEGSRGKTCDPDLKLKYTINPWNGAINEKYAWSQTFRDLTLEILSSDKITPKDVSVLITKERLTVKHRDQVIIDGEFSKPVNCFDSVWTIEDGCRILLNIEKSEEYWWDCVIKGDETIDTQEIESVKRLDEFSPSEQNSILKMIKDHKEKERFKSNLL